jgi:hypothetical protein
MAKTIAVDFDDMKSIKRAERMKKRLENENYALIRTVHIGLSKFKLFYKKVI